MVSIDFIRAGCSTLLKTRGERFSELWPVVRQTLGKADALDEVKAQATKNPADSHDTTAGCFF